MAGGRQAPRGRGGAHGGRGRGRGGAQGRGGGHSNSARPAKPAVATLPSALHIHPSSSPIPPVIVNAFPEFRKPQSFFSALERLRPEFGGSTDGYRSSWLGISEEHLVSVTRKEGTGFEATLHLTNGQEQPVFVKRIHLLEPVSAMEGEYVWPDDGALPSPSDLWKTALAKLNDPMNEAYVDALFAMAAHRLVESNLSPHWCRCYGTFSARVEKYLYNVSDEYESMRKESWWVRNQRLGLFRVYKEDGEDNESRIVPAQHSKFLSEGLTEIMADDFDSVLEHHTGDNHGKEGLMANTSETEPDLEPMGSPQFELAPVVLVPPKLRLKRLSSSSGSGSSGSGSGSGSSGSSSSSMSEYEQFVEFSNFPVQVTLLEKAEGTLEELIDLEDDTMEETKEARWTAWIFQVIAALTEAQHWFGFVHNDLHSNNVMWSGTGVTHLYYRVQRGKDLKDSYILKVPTYGRLLKIIDFGRSSFHLPDPAGFFISDAFYPGNDAATQYNCEPFYDSDLGKKVEPNPSFDLCRLSVSLIESLYPERPEAVKPVKIMSKEGNKLYTETVSSVYNLLWEWLQDDDGKNVLRLPDGEERYPDFDLYRVLAAEIHRAVPSRQIEKALFRGFRCDAKDIPTGESVYDLHL